MRERESIEFVLHAAVEESRARFVDSGKQLKELSGKTGRDVAEKNAAKVRQVRSSHREARAEFGLALKRFNAFILDGKVPSDLQDGEVLSDPGSRRETPPSKAPKPVESSRHAAVGDTMR